MTVEFNRVRDARRPPLDGIVRVPHSQGFTRLRWVDPNRTHVIYQLDSDPGGSLPRWLIRWISKDLPSRILKSLRKQVSKTRNDYRDFQRLWDPRQSWQVDTPQQFNLPGVLKQRLAPEPSTPSPSVHPSVHPTNL